MRSAGFFLLLTVLIASSWSCPVSAEDFAQSEVMVDVTGTDATQAREKALAQGEKEAFAKLIERLAPTQAKAHLSAIPPEQISGIVQGFEVVDEKISANRYQATLRYKFDEEQVRSIIGQAGGKVPEAAMQSTGAIVALPVWHEAGVAQLWEDLNEWRNAWSRAAIEAGNGRVVTPFGDLTDISDIDANSTLSGGYARFNRLMARYGAGEVLVAEARLREAATPSTLDVTLRHLNPKGQEVVTASYVAEGEEKPIELMQRAAADIIQRLSDGAGLTPEAPREENETVAVVARLSKLSDWVMIRRRLLALPSVAKLELQALSPNQADMVLHVKGEPELLVRGMAAQGLKLSQGEGYWVLTY